MKTETLLRLRGRVSGAIDMRIALLSLPAATLILHRAAGDLVLITVAIVLPLALAVYTARQRNRARAASEEGRSFPGRPELLGYLGALQACVPARPTACLVARFDGADTTDAPQATARIDDLAHRLRAALRPDDVVARIDDVTLAVATTPGSAPALESAIQTALTIQRAADLPMAGAPALTASIGVSLSTRMPDAGPTSLLDAAEQALERVQRTARREIRFHCDEDASACPIQIGLADDLLRGFSERQIGAWFQPQICTDTGKLTGVEALVRWEHPELGILSPGDFLPTIHAAGLMPRLTDTMLDDGLAALAEWDRRGLDVARVSVNFTTEDLADPCLPDRIAWALDRHDLDARRLGVEVLETVLNQGADERIPANLKALKAMGCMIDLDDFGTGNASISNIRRFCIDRLKIDRAFVRDIDSDRDQQSMVAAILTMAEQLGIEALAEGIETQAEYAMLSQLGCTHVQGFGIGRPMGVSSLPGWLARLHENRPVLKMPAALCRRGPPTDPGSATRRREPPRGGKTA